MKRIADFSIRSKLTIMVMAAIGAALVAAVAGWFGVETQNRREQLRARAQATAQVIANSCDVATEFESPHLTSEILNALGADPQLGQAAIYDLAGRPVAVYQRPGWKNPSAPASGQEYAEFKAGHLELAQALGRGGRRWGTVVIQMQEVQAAGQIWRGLGMLLAAAVFAAGVGYLLMRRWHRSLVRPLAELSAAARAVAEDREFAPRVVPRDPDELGILVADCNEMLLQVGRREKALREAYHELERRAADRTRELYATNQKLFAEVNNHKRAREESDALREHLQAAFADLQAESAGRAATQHKLQLSEERFSQAFKTSPVAMAILSRGRGVFLDVNDRFALLAERSRAELLGRGVFEIALWSPPETRARLEQLLADGQPVRQWAGSIVGPGQKASSAVLAADSFRLEDDDCVLVVTEDVSERVSLEAQLRQSQKMEAVGQLAAGVAHDFNNLLTVVQGYTQMLLLLEPAAGPKREALEKIGAATKRAAGLTSQLMTFSRKQVAAPRAVDLNKVVISVAGMLQPLLGENVTLEVRAAAQLPAILADAAMLEQVIVNLAVNARDAMPRGGRLVLSTFATEILASYVKNHPQARAGHFVCLQVEDGGTGMDAATMERIFEPFFTTKGAGKGTGLGLATVYGIVAQHRGWVEVSSQRGVGSIFKVMLPAERVAAGQTEILEHPDPVRGGQETILVVEDETSLRELVTKVLRQQGYQVLEAAHGHEALRLWQDTPRKPELLLTDMMMPEGMTGWELARQIRAGSPEVKVLFTSGYSPEIFGTDVRLDEKCNFLPKPYHPRLLAKAVRSCLDNERLERAHAIRS